MSRPLEGILVADFSRVLAGPLATVTLADLGATVVKVERPGSGDDTRQWGPPWTESSSSYFESANRGKRSVCLDLDDDDDLVLARELALRADVLVENFASGTMRRRGLDQAALTEINPGLVYASVSGFGSAEGAGRPGYDFLVQAVGGLMSITGPPEEPSKVGVALVDVLTSKDLVIGVLAALHERETSGRGQLVEVNLLSSLLGSMANQASGYLTTGRDPSSMGNAHPSIAPYETLRAADGALAIACGNDRQFASLAEALGVPGLAEDPRFATNRDRVAHRPAMVAALESALATDTVDHWVEAVGLSRVPCGRVGSLADGFRLADELGLDPVSEVGDGGIPQVRSPLWLGRTPVGEPTRPPRLGEHDDEVRRWLQVPRSTPETTTPHPRVTEHDR
ncbi:CoA transferase [Marmoricola endophyticus]|uniref:CoA transferase n=1 Tax=Marmoricola endophyticus TaxID=2040280 RepID=A0A917BNT6_9ACTN|nr:CoA transferase [Marmoricola endophyticus]GGF51189.1 CoA transferase [Marmoricola endophyticus]